MHRMVIHTVTVSDDCSVYSRWWKSARQCERKRDNQNNVDVVCYCSVATALCGMGTVSTVRKKRKITRITKI